MLTLEKLINKFRERKIKRDFLESRKRMFLLVGNPNSNFEVIDRNYLNPRISGLVLPINHPDGLFVYYSKLNGYLRDAWDNHFINDGLISTKSPEYVRKFVRSHGE